MTLFEMGCECGCKFAIYNRSIAIKLCQTHYEKHKGDSIMKLLATALRTLPEWGDDKCSVCEEIIKFKDGRWVHAAGGAVHARRPRYHAAQKEGSERKMNNSTTPRR